MAMDLTTIAVVLDHGFGAELEQLAGQMPVWIVDSAANRPAIEREWTRRRQAGAERELSVFRMIEGMSPGEHLVALLRTIEAAHGEGAQERPFTTLLVFGAKPDDAMSASIHAAGGGVPVATDEGFRVAFARARLG